MDLGTIVQAILAGLLGGTIVPYLTHAKEQRAVRSIVRGRIAEVEHRRWCTKRDLEADFDIRPLLSRLEAEAISAGLPRDAVSLYTCLAEVSYLSTVDTVGKYARTDKPFDVGALPGDVNAIVEASCDILVDALWRPVRSRITRQWRMRSVRATVTALLKHADSDDVEWEPWYVQEFLFPNMRRLRNIRKH
jgi:hypothetical protein